MSAQDIARTERDAFVDRMHARAVRRVTRTLSSGALVIGAWFWGIFALATVAVPLIVNASGGVMDGGVSTGLEFSSRWFAFGMGVGLTATILCSHLGAGGTRRALRTGSVWASLVVGVVYGLAFILILLLEQAVFGALGWVWEPHGAGLTADGGTWVVVTALSEAVVAATYLLGGVAVVGGYQTYGLWRGTLLVLPALVLLFLADVASRTGTGEAVLDGVAGGLGTTTPVVGLVAGVAVLVLAAGAAHLQLVNLRLRPTR